MLVTVRAFTCVISVVGVRHSLDLRLLFFASVATLLSIFKRLRPGQQGRYWSRLATTLRPITRTFWFQQVYSRLMWFQKILFQRTCHRGETTMESFLNVHRYERVEGIIPPSTIHVENRPKFVERFREGGRE